ncbi:MAG: type II toxin-antitoxin system YoeB family toxin [Acidobacteria bacterium]|nr:type II toxin-antitoxin system YoeB family toxin [Acidobacteriota bacterium]
MPKRLHHGRQIYPIGVVAGGRVGDLAGAFSRRINVQHRLVYQVYKSERVVKVIRLWTHYE